MHSWTKLFSGLLTSTIWQEDLATKVVWITMLAAKDSQGRVEGAVPGLAHLAGVSVEQCEKALRKFMAPDKYSRSQEHEGRRIQKIDGGWIVLNHFKYRDGMEDQRDRWRLQKAQQRARKGSKKVQRQNDKREERFVRAVEDGDEEKADGICAEGIPPA